MPWISTFDRREIPGVSAGQYRDSDARWKVVLHSTEGSTIAGAESTYAKRKIAPHFTIDLVKREKHQHLSTDLSASAMRGGSGGFETNHARAIQIEIVGFANKSHTWPTADLNWLVDEVLLKIYQAHPDLGLSAPRFLGEGDGYLAKVDAKQRFSGAAFRDFSGICGHQHVPFNHHWDPGRLPIDHIVERLRQLRELTPGGGATVVDSGDQLTVGVRIIAETTVTIDHAAVWAAEHDAHQRFAEEILPAIWAAETHGVDRSIVAAQAAHETGWGRFGGVIGPDRFNTAGIKTTAGGDDHDPDAHHRFENWNQGAQAQVDHLALYAGVSGVPFDDTPDPRHFASIAGTATTVEELGARWAPSGRYGELVLNHRAKLIAISSAANEPAVELDHDSSLVLAYADPDPVAHALSPVQLGEQGIGILALQVRLNDVLGAVGSTTRLKPDGDFGTQTESAVREIEKALGSVSTGQLNSLDVATLTSAESLQALIDRRTT